MVTEIGVYLDAHGQTAFLHQRGRLVVYGKQQKKWHSLREISLALNQSGGLSGLRRQVVILLDFLGDCKVFVARSVTGLPYYELEKARCSVWELEGRPQDFLEYVLAEEIQAREPKNDGPRPIPLEPQEVSPGCYAISLKEIQARHAGVTSKQVLLPFLRRGKFSALEITCSHVPPWLEAELTGGCLSGRVELLDQGEVRISILQVTREKLR